MENHNSRNTFDFDRFVNELIKYKNSYGDLLVPSSYVTPLGYKLGLKVLSVRSHNIRTSLKQKEKLNSLGFVWNTNVHKFEIFIAKLEEYKAKFGDLLVPYPYTCEDGYNLGRKVVAYRYRKDELTLIQRKMLDNIGFVWELKPFHVDFLDELSKYKEKYGNLDVPRAYVTEDGYKLGGKVSCVRAGQIKLVDDLEDRLNDMGFVWSHHAQIFNRFFNELLAYKEEFGHLYISISYKTKSGYELGKKAFHFSNSKLTKKEIEKLKSIGFPFNETIFDYQFSILIDELVKYKAEFGNLLVPQHYVCENGYRLGKKVSSIRTKSHKYSQERITKLKEIGFIFDTQSENFNKFYNELLKFYEKYGNVNMPYRYTTEEGYKLGQKFHNLRFGNMSLTNEQIEKLATLGLRDIAQKTKVINRKS